MRLESVTPRNFWSYKEPGTLDLRGYDQIIVTGENGAGKSTLFGRGPRWAIWGVSDVPIEALVRQGETECSFGVEFVIGGTLYRVQRTRGIGKGATSSLEFEVRTDAGWISRAGSSIPDTQRKIIETVGFDYDVAVATAFAEQDKWSAFAESDPKDRRSILGRLLGVAAWGGRRKACSERVNKLKAKASELNGTIGARQPEADRIPELTALLNEWSSKDAFGALDATKAESAVDAAQEAISALMIEQETIRAVVDRWQQAHDAKTRLEAQHINALQKERMVEVQLAMMAPPGEPVSQDRIDAARATLEEAQRAHAAAQLDYQRHNQTVQDLLREVQYVERAITASREADVRRHREAVATAERSLQDARSAASRAADALAAAQRTASRLQDVPCQSSDACSTHPAFAATCRSCPLIAMAAEASDALPALATGAEQADQARINAESAAQAAQTAPLDPDPSIAANEAQIADLQKKIAAERASASAAETTLTGLGQRAVEARIQVDALVMEYTAVIAAQKERSDLQVELRSCQSRSQTLAEELATATAAATQAQTAMGATRGTSAIAEDITAAHEGLAAALRTRTIARDVLDAARRQVATHEAQLSRAKDAEAELATLRAATAALHQEIADFADLAVAYQDVPTMLIEAAVPAIEAEANAMLSQVSARGLSLAISTQRETKSDTIQERIEILVRDHMGERPYLAYSGGEKFRINWALRIALTHVAASYQATEIDTLLIDEGFGSLDVKGIDAFSRTLAESTKMFGRTIVVSHIPSMTDSIANRLYLENGPNGTTWRWEG